MKKKQQKKSGKLTKIRYILYTYWIKFNLLFNHRAFVFRNVKNKLIREALVQTMKELESGETSAASWHNFDTSTYTIKPSKKHSFGKGDPDFDAIPKNPDTYREVLAKYGLNFDEGITFSKDYPNKQHRGKIPDFNK